jgi:hypothetical protein
MYECPEDGHRVFLWADDDMLNWCPICGGVDFIPVEGATKMWPGFSRVQEEGLKATLVEDDALEEPDDAVPLHLVAIQDYETSLTQAAGEEQESDVRALRESPDLRGDPQLNAPGTASLMSALHVE